jgi:UDP-N-acetylglucosamine transferase subunit ALG13
VSALIAPAAARQAPVTARIVVTVGTDHHPFDRLIGWVNNWLERHPELAGEVFVQTGAASVVPACQSSSFLPVGRLDELLNAADVIVCHGGPASIADAWSRGRLPVVVPRLPQLGEHVDDHQVDFCRKVAELGRVRLAQTAADFAAFLDEAARDPSRFRARIPETDLNAAVTRVAELVDELVSQPRRRLSLINRGRLNRRRPVTGSGAPAAPGNMSPGLTPEASTSWQEHLPVRVGLAGLPNEEQE